MTLSLFDGMLSAAHLRDAGIEAQTAQQALVSLDVNDPILRAIFAQSFAYAGWVLVAIAAVGLLTAWIGFRERSIASSQEVHSAM